MVRLCFYILTDTTRQPGKRRKRKSSTGSAANVNNSVAASGKKNRSPGPQGINTSVPGVSKVSPFLMII